MDRVLVTGGAGFIGSRVAHALLRRGVQVSVLDNLDPFYDVAIKRRNLETLGEEGGDQFRFLEGDIRDPAACRGATAEVTGVIHLAALAGVRPSILEPTRYADVNVVGTQVLLEAMQSRPGVPVVFGSSSSVYGGNRKVPFSEEDPVDRPVSPYAATKKAGEVICHSFQHLSGNPLTCVRLFTVFGPGQRPEMAIHQFSRRLLAGEPLPFYGDGQSARDYTYVDDIVDGILAALERAEGYRIYNLGGSVATSLDVLVQMLEEVFDRKATLDRRPAQAGDMPVTHADIAAARRDLGWEPKVPLIDGLRQFADWYLRERSEGRLP